MNYEWVMAKGLTSLKMELRRRKGDKNVLEPSEPTFLHKFWN